MKLVVKPKKEVSEKAQFYGDAFGVTAIISLAPDQIWNAEHSNGYWHLRKKGTGIELRLTELAMSRLFEEVKT